MWRKIVTEIPGPNSRTLMARRRQSVARGPFHSTPVFVARAHGAILEDVDGNTFLDFASGIGVVNVGHTPESVVNAIQDQATRLLHGSFNVTPYEGYLALAEKLNAKTPGAFQKKTLLVNSGAEAVENAVKIARAYTKRPAILAFEHGFHGRTYMAMTLTAKEKPYKEGFGPLCSDVYRAPFPYVYRWPGSEEKTEQQISEECFAEFKKIVNEKIGASALAAVIIEPVAGEGGFLPVPKAFFQMLRDYCTANQSVLIADEIQTGFGRTGALFACERLGITPDLMTLAKGMGAGLPIAAVTGRAEIMDAPIEGGIGGTYGGNPLACAAALEVIRLFDGPHLLSRARNIAEVLEARLSQWKERFPVVGDIRGLGAMRAIELVRDRKTKEPDKEGVGQVLKYAYQNGVIALSAGTHGNVIRLLMPLVIEPTQLAEGLDVLEEGLKKC